MRQDNVLVIEGDLYTDERLDYEWIQKESLKHYPNDDPTNSLIVTGNVYAEKGILDGYDSLICLFVKGDVYTPYISAMEEGIVHIMGTAYIHHYIYGTYESILNIDNLSCPYLIRDNEFMPTASIQKHIIIILDAGYSKNEVCLNIDLEKENIEKTDQLFNSKVWRENDNFDVNSFGSLLKKGMNPFKEIEE